ncbi:MAG: carbamoyl-phosphate synthase large subunit, partial [Pseudomonadales bacterium]
MITGEQRTGLPSKVLLLGSGGLSIGQAGEFDYSGNQALKAMREEGVEVILVNPNIATVQTNPEENISVYLYPVEAEWVERVIEKERPDGIIASFGGQTALNCLLELDEKNVLRKYRVENLGTPVSVLRMTEDRDEFSSAMQSINQPVPASVACENLAAAQVAAASIGYPVIVRAAYTLGGLGSGFAKNASELEELVIGALASSPQVLVEKSLRGWKELEYEVMRDRQSNCITICNMENLDPMGIHTGDSIVVAPSQTLSDADYQMLRDASLHIINSLGVIGECNVQFALSSDSAEYYVIEVNARLSRSSALASKATGYPIAYIASKVVLGYDLLELPNPVTGITCAFFEPALDYVAVKIPRWDLNKFIRVNKNLGSTMKSVGEVMAIGRTFPEALQKAVRMVSENMMGLSRIHLEMEDNYREILQQATDTRLFAVVEALRKGLKLKEVHDLTEIDQWFLHHIERIVSTEKEIQAFANGAGVGAPKETVSGIFKQIEESQWRNWKLLGFGDEQIAGLVLDECAPQTQYSLSDVQQASLAVRALRLACGVRPVVKKIDTTAGEYPSPSNYVYMTYGGHYDDPLTA